MTAPDARRVKTSDIPVSSDTSPAPCRRCGSTALHHAWQRFAGGTRHVREDCARCGAYRRYAPRTPLYARLADEASP
jgi:hypothetical protein